MTVLQGKGRPEGSAHADNMHPSQNTAQDPNSMVTPPANTHLYLQTGENEGLLWWPSG